MGPMDAEEWLENWVAENLNTPGWRENKREMGTEADTCRAEAAAAGSSVADLTEAAGGDLEGYLFRAKNSLTDQHVEKDG